MKGQGELDLEADNYYFAPTFLRGTPKQKAQGGNRERVEYAARFQHPGSTPGCRYPEKGKSGGGNHFPAVRCGVLFLQVSLGARHEWRAADWRCKSSGRFAPKPQIKRVRLQGAEQKKDIKEEIRFKREQDKMIEIVFET